MNLLFGGQQFADQGMFLVIGRLRTLSRLVMRAIVGFVFLHPAVEVDVPRTF